jgi:hypothetical protein
MKTKEKDAVIQLFVTHRRSAKDKYYALVKLLLNLPNATAGQKRFYNASRYSAGTLSTLEYDIKKLCAITDKEMSKAVKEDTKPLPLTGEQRLVKVDPKASREILLQQAIELTEFSQLDKYLPGPLKEFTKGLLGNVERKAWLEEKEVDHKFTKKADLDILISKVYNQMVVEAQNSAIGDLLEAQDNLIKSINVEVTHQLERGIKIVLNEAPAAVKESIKLIDEFPFLDDDDCPDEFKILLSDKFKAYRKYLEGRKELKAIIAAGATNEDIFAIAKKTVENYELNLDIYDELNYYKEDKQILGKHQIFEDRMQKQRVGNMSTIELTQSQKNLRSYVSRDQKAFNKMKAGDAKTKFGQKLKSWKDELVLVDARLDKIS